MLMTKDGWILFVIEWIMRSMKCADDSNGGRKEVNYKT
jgi:hypothetical protein